MTYSSQPSEAKICRQYKAHRPIRARTPLMDAIDTFLDAMFAPYPTTPRLLEAKGELHAMMEDHVWLYLHGLSE